MRIDNIRAGAATHAHADQHCTGTFRLESAHIDTRELAVIRIHLSERSTVFLNTRALRLGILGG